MMLDELSRGMRIVFIHSSANGTGQFAPMKRILISLAYRGLVDSVIRVMIFSPQHCYDVPLENRRRFGQAKVENRPVSING